MPKLIIDKLPRIIKARKELEKELGIKIANRGREIYIKGSPENVYLAEKVILALDFGFPMSCALLIKKQECGFAIININEHSNSKNTGRAKARIIGRNGKVLQTLCSISECFFEVNGHDVGIIGDLENIKCVREAIIMLIKGAKHGNVYGFLEKKKSQPITDLGLKKKE